MRFSHLLWLSMAAAGTMMGEAAMFGWNKKEEVVAESNEVPIPQSNRSIRSIINEDRRFVLYNSRKLSGECLDVCVPIPDSPTPDPKKPPAPSPLGGVAPTDSPTKAPTAAPTKVPTNSPTKTPTDAPTKTPTKAPTGLDCATLKNLGHGFSEPTGPKHYAKCYPHIVSLDAYRLPGRDDSVAFFVGGDYNGIKCAEVEGQVVVLGSMRVKNSGPSNFVSVGLGSHVIPNSDTDCIIVGKDITTDRHIQVFNQNHKWKCDIVYRGNQRNIEWWKTNGDSRHVPDYDLTFYEQMKHVLLKKSKYWATLPATGKVSEKYTTTTFDCKSNTDIEVFNIDGDDYEDWSKLRRATSYKFTKSCKGKTILFNLLGKNDLKVPAVDMYDYNGKVGYKKGGFDTCFTQNILWNVPHAKNVEIGAGGSSEFMGSLLVTGNLRMTTTGHSGRTMILGDVWHNRGGSEFHSYPYNPPVPLPDPKDICVLPDDLDAPVKDYPTPAPSAKPTFPPTQKPTNPPVDKTRCTAIPQKRLPKGSWETNNHECKKCQPPNNKKYWPCNKKPRLCEGNCKFSN